MASRACYRKWLRTKYQKQRRLVPWFRLPSGEVRRSWTNRGPVNKHECGVCGEAFYSYKDNFDASYCSPQCKYEAAKRRKRVEHAEQRCTHCGKTFLPRRSDARHCSAACRQAEYRKRLLRLA